MSNLIKGASKLIYLSDKCQTVVSKSRACLTRDRDVDPHAAVGFQQGNVIQHFSAGLFVYLFALLGLGVLIWLNVMLPTKHHHLPALHTHMDIQLLGEYSA